MKTPTWLAKLVLVLSCLFLSGFVVKLGKIAEHFYEHTGGKDSTMTQYIWVIVVLVIIGTTATVWGAFQTGKKEAK